MRASYTQVLALAACAAAAPLEKRQVFSPPVDFSTTAAASAAPSSAPAGSGIMSILPVTSAAASGTGCSVSYVTPTTTAGCTQTISLGGSGSSAAAPVGSAANSSVAAGSSAAAPAATGVAGTPGSSTGGLNEAFVAKGKLYLGNIADPGTLSNQGTVDLLNSDFGQITPENSMKWDATEASQGAFSFDSADQTAAFAAENGKLLRCHALLWHSQLPTWVSSITDPTELTSVIENHIAEVAGHFAGQCYAWDVINEMFNEDGSLRESVFYNVLGEDFVSIAFNAARAADPNAKLYINDYNIDSTSYAKTQGYVSKITEWIAAGIPIDGVGTQAHLSSGHTGTQELLELLATTGATEVAVTELDIGNGTGDDYVQVVDACANVPECVGVTVWGVTDGQSWRAGEAATLFNDDFSPKEAYTTLLESLQ